MANTSAIWQQAAHTTYHLLDAQQEHTTNLMKNVWEFSGKSQENGPLAEKWQDRKSKRNRQKKTRGDRKGESNNSPEIPDRGVLKHPRPPFFSFFGGGGGNCWRYLSKGGWGMCVHNFIWEFLCFGLSDITLFQVILGLPGINALVYVVWETCLRLCTCVFHVFELLRYVQFNSLLCVNV